MLTLIFPLFIVLSFFYIGFVIRSVLNQELQLRDALMLSLIVIAPFAMLIFRQNFAQLSQALGVETPFALLFSFLFFLVFLMMYILIRRIAALNNENRILAQKLALLTKQTLKTRK